MLVERPIIVVFLVAVAAPPVGAAARSLLVYPMAARVPLARAQVRPARSPSARA